MTPELQATLLTMVETLRAELVKPTALVDDREVINLILDLQDEAIEDEEMAEAILAADDLDEEDPS